LADVEARQTGADRPEFAADLGRGVPLHVEGLKLARRAVEVEEDARLRLAEARFVPRRRRLRFREAEEVGQTNAEQAETAGAQHLAPRPAAAQSSCRSEDLQHELPP